MLVNISQPRYPHARLVEQAALIGYQALALTDLENLYGQVRFHHLCEIRGLKAITGIEFRPGFDGRRSMFGHQAAHIQI
jgi:DNA polymerase III alpha subunit